MYVSPYSKNPNPKRMPGQPQVVNSTVLQQSQNDINYATADEQPHHNSNSFNNSHNVSVSNNPAGNQAQQEYGGNLGSNMPAVQGNNFNGSNSMQGKGYQ